MNEITYNNTVGTFSQIIIVAGLLASNLFPAKTVDKNHMVYMQPSQTEYTPTYNWSALTTNPSFNLEHGTIESDSFEKSVGNFYARLLARQEPLGADFEEVLQNNLWDLYES